MSESDLSEHKYGDLMNLARSAREQFDSVDIDTDAPTKDELIESLEEYEPEGSREDGWTIEVDGSSQDVDLLDVQTPEHNGSGGGGPTDKTILYALTRKETTEDRVEELRAAVEGNSRFELREAGTEGDKYSFVLPAEEQEGYVEESDEEAESDEESGSDEEQEESSDEDEEAESEETEADESEESEEDEDEEEEEEADDEVDEDEGTVPHDVYKERLEDKTDDELYSIAVDMEIEGRADMNKAEKIEAILEERIEEGKVAAPAQ